MGALLLDVIAMLMVLVVIALIAGVIVWALQKLFPATPAIVFNAIYVLAVLLALYVIVSWFLGLPPLARVR